MTTTLAGTLRKLFSVRGIASLLITASPVCAASLSVPTYYGYIAASDNQDYTFPGTVIIPGTPPLGDHLSFTAQAPVNDNIIGVSYVSYPLFPNKPKVLVSSFPSIIISNSGPSIYASAAVICQLCSGILPDQFGGNPPYSATSYGEMEYQVEFNGPNGSIPVNLQALLAVGSDAPWEAGGEASALIGIEQQGFEGNGFLYPGSVQSSDYPESLHVNQTFDLLANVPINVEIEASAQTPITNLDSAYADVDPILSIDPTFANADQYAFEISQGVTQAISAVPLPQSWLIFGTALSALVGVQVRKSRRSMSSFT